jgi:TalC/MipB family fructose-6-phosphate aldolase
VAIQHGNHLGILTGITTNPAILSRSNKDFEETIYDLLEIQPGLVAVQVTGKTYNEIIKQAHKLASISHRIIIKIPAIHEGFKAISHLERESIRTLATTIFESKQILMAALCGATYAAPYVNRIETATGNAFDMLEESQTIINRHGFRIKIMAAAIKSVEQFVRCAALGINTVTLPSEVYDELFSSNAHIDESLNQFDIAWNSNELLKKSSFFTL